MKKLAILLSALSLFVALTAGKPQIVKRTVVYASDVECKNCEKKVLENISFEKGVKDVKVDLSEQKVTIVFDQAKTDTCTLAKALRKLGYCAEVVKFE